MICCYPITQTFINETVTTVPYTGNEPTVSLAYLQTDGTFITTGIMSQIKITPTQVIIDHGGPASGIVKLITQ